MRWEDERYVRLYTRDTLTWKRLGWEGRAVLPQLMRKVDRAGVVEIDGGDPGEALALLLDMPEEIAKAAWPKLISTGTVTLRDEPSRAIILPNYIEAQEAKASDPARARKHRELARVRKTITPRDHEVTPRDGTVTGGHAASQAVTPSLAVPSLAVPSLAVPETNALSAAPTVGVLPVLAGQPDDAGRVFEEWRRVMGKTAAAQFTKEREKAVRGRLKEGYSVERLFKAIRGNKLSPHHQGQNIRNTVYDDLELICRDGTHVETFEGFVDRPPQPSGAAQLQVSQKLQSETPGRKVI